MQHRPSASDGLDWQLPPQSGEIGVGVRILPHGGGVQFALITDEALCADPQAIIDRFEPKFALRRQA